MKQLLSGLLICLLVGCVPSSNREDTYRDTALLRLLTIGGSCTKRSLSNTIPIGDTNITDVNPFRTEFDVANCSAAGLYALGFVSAGISAPGVTGTTANSSIGSRDDYMTGTAQGINVEVTYKMLQSGGLLDVTTNGSLAGAAVSGPGFALSDIGQQTFDDVMTVSPFQTLNRSFASGVGRVQTLCLEVQQVNGSATYYGWVGACSGVNINNPDFLSPGVTSAFPGGRVGFTLVKCAANVPYNQ